jgi:LuxR family transcriptional regulator
MPNQEKISELIEKLHIASPAGFAVGLHVIFTTPRYMFQSYEKTWLDTYSRLGLVLRDPVVRWGFSNTGSIRWSGLADQDDTGVLDKAAEHGLRYGTVIAMVRSGSRSMGGFARSDREPTDQEIAELTADLTELHDLTQKVERLAPSVHETLKQMSIYLTHG